ncbi:MAG TPA: HIT domain-containing protein [Thermoplasmata archaeon]|jgi:histidine triad (HIT) family protein|nr:HIT domain-containing protein [Thermoplasmata archaeon]
MAPPEPSAPPECVFCRIAEHRAPAHVLYEDDATMAFLDIFPFTRGHALVIPKRHGARITDLPLEDQTRLVQTLDTICRRSERLTDDYNVALNAGARAGQIVFHVHFHVIPRYGEANPFHPNVRNRLADDDARALVATLSAP